MRAFKGWIPPQILLWYLDHGDGVASQMRGRLPKIESSVDWTRSLYHKKAIVRTKKCDENRKKISEERKVVWNGEREIIWKVVREWSDFKWEGERACVHLQGERERERPRAKERRMNEDRALIFSLGDVSSPTNWDKAPACVFVCVCTSVKEKVKMCERGEIEEMHYTI